MAYAHIIDYLGDIRAGGLSEPPGGYTGSDIVDAKLIAYARGLRANRNDYIGWLKDKISREPNPDAAKRLRLWVNQIEETYV